VRLVGRPTSRIAQEIGELAAELGVAKRVESVGGVEGAALWAQHEWADVFAYPTNDDAQPLVVLEAMAAGLPVVASRIGGIPQTLDTAGILIEPRDHEALAASLHSLIEDPELRLRLGTAARTRFVSHYNVEAFQQRFDRLFGEILRALST
jgi:glycosyltransferase involved in cell wall biosynthesis